MPDAIAAVVQHPDTPEGLSFVYMSAIADPGCGSDLLMPDDGMRIKETLDRLLTDRFAEIATRVRIDNTASLRGTEGTLYAELFSSCALPETISGYFKCLDHLREGKAHGAGVV